MPRLEYGLCTFILLLTQLFLYYGPCYKKEVIWINVILVGETPDYRGCRLSGIPFICEDMFTQE